MEFILELVEFVEALIELFVEQWLNDPNKKKKQKKVSKLST